MLSVQPAHAALLYCIDSYVGCGEDPVQKTISRFSWSRNHKLIGYDFTSDASGCEGLDGIGPVLKGRWIGFWTMEWEHYLRPGQSNAHTHCLAGERPELPDLGQPKGCDSPVPTAGNPITLSNGNKFQQETDLVVQNGLSIKRYYNSHRMVQQGSQGLNWRHQYEYAIKPMIDDYGKGFLVFVNHDGSEESFEGYLSQPGQWSANNPRYGIEQLSSGNWVVTKHNGARFVFNSDYQILSAESVNGVNTIWSYNQDGLLEKVVRSGVGEITYTHNAQGLIETATTGGKTVGYEYDADKRLVNVILPDDTPNDLTDNPTKQYHYLSGSDKRLLTGITNEKGVLYASWSYDYFGKAISSEHAGGVDKYTIDYSGSTYVYVTGPLGRVVTYKFQEVNGKNRLFRVTGDTSAASTYSCAATNAHYAYNSDGFVSSTTDHEGNITNYQRDSLGRITQRTEAAGTSEARVTTTEWHATFNKPSAVTTATQRAEYSYDAKGRVISTKVIDLATQTERITSVTYHADANGVVGKLASINGPRTDVNDVTNYAYNAEHQLSSVTDALGNTVQFQNYDAQGRAQTIIDENGVSTNIAYDWRGNALQTNVAGQITNYSYDLVGNLVEITRDNGFRMAFEYDDANRLIAIENEGGARIEYELDVAGNRLKQTVKDEQGLITYQQQQVFDELSRLRQVIGYAGQTTQIDYDLNDNVVQTTDAESNTNQYQYDALDRVITSLDAQQQPTQVDHTPEGQVASVTDPRGNTTQYQTNGFGETTNRTSPDTGVTTYQYDSAGNMVQMTNANGVAVIFQYDALNRLVGIDHVNDTYDVTYTYGEADAQYGKGRLTRVQDASGTTTFDYTATGQVAAVNRLLGGNVFTTSYSYDNYGLLIGMTLPSGRQVTYTNHPSGQVAAIQAELNNQTKPLVSNVQYQPFGPMKGFEYGNQYQSQRIYDFDGQLIQIKMPMGSNGSVDALPIANAGIVQSVYEHEQVQLDASASSSANGALTYQWVQIGGIEVELTNPDSATPSFTTPEVSETQQLVFKLTVEDINSLVAQDTVTISVLAKPELPDYKVTPVYGQGNVLTLTWEEANAATYYVVEISTTADFSSDVQQVYQGSDTGFSTTLTSAGEYYVRIKACNADRCTDWDATAHSSKVGYRLIVVRSAIGGIVVPVLDR